MLLRSTIARKILISYLLIIFAVGMATLFLLGGLKRNRRINEQITNVYIPSVAYLNDMRTMVVNSKMLIKNWVFISSKPNTPEKLRLQQIQDNDFLQLAERLEMLVPGWPLEDQERYQFITFTIRDTLFPGQKYVMELLADFESYNRPAVMFEAMSMVEEDNDEIMYVTHKVLSQLEQLIAVQEVRVLEAKQQMKISFDRFRNLVWLLGLLIFLISAAAAWYSYRVIVRPLTILTAAARELAENNSDVQVLLNSDDEFKEMADALNRLGECMQEKKAGEGKRL
jgi:methyl-accepting chemotaxis protein